MTRICVCWLAAGNRPISEPKTVRKHKFLPRNRETDGVQDFGREYEHCFEWECRCYVKESDYGIMREINLEFSTLYVSGRKPLDSRYSKTYVVTLNPISLYQTSKKVPSFFIQQRAPNNPTSAFRLWIFIFTKFEKFVSVTRIIASRTNATLNNEQL